MAAETSGASIFLELEGEEEALAALHGMLGTELDDLPEDLGGRLNLLRFLRGHNHKPETAAKYFRSMVKWRAAHGMAELRALTEGKELGPLENLPGGDTVRSFVTMVAHAGWSRDGHLVQFGCPGKINIPGLMRTIGVDGFERFWHSMLEVRHQLLAHESAARGHVVKVAMVRDLAGIGTHLLTADARSLLIKLVKGAQDNFPESMDRIVFINTPAFFSFVMAIIRPLLNKRTLDKFLVLGADWVASLLEVLDCSSLRTLVQLCQRGTAAEGCHDGRHVHELAVGARDSTTLRVAVAQGAIFRYEFALASGDINFTAIAFEGNAGLPVQEATRCSAGEKACSGEFEATHEHGAILQLKWDNTHSWMTGKALTCTTEVVLAG